MKETIDKRTNPRCDEGQYVPKWMPIHVSRYYPQFTRLQVSFSTRFQISLFSYTAFRVSKFVFRFRFSAPRFSVFTHDREIQPLYLFNFWSVTKSVTLREK